MPRGDQINQKVDQNCGPRGGIIARSAYQIAAMSIAFVPRFFLVCVLWLVAAFNNTASAEALTIQNDSFWKDTTGTAIYSQGGGMLKVGATLLLVRRQVRRCRALRRQSGLAKIRRAL